MYPVLKYDAEKPLLEIKDYFLIPTIQIFLSLKTTNALCNRLHSPVHVSKRIQNVNNKKTKLSKQIDKKPPTKKKNPKTHTQKNKKKQKTNKKQQQQHPPQKKTNKPTNKQTIKQIKKITTPKITTENKKKIATK